MRLLALLLISAGSVFAAEPLQVIIFSGGVSEADGKAALSSFERIAPSIGQVVTLPEGEPRVVESGTLPGLKPGFRVVTLGLCRDPKVALAAIKSVYPGAYSKALTADVGPERCPQPTAMVVKALDGAGRVGGLVITAFTVSEPEHDDRGADVSSSTVTLVLVDKKSGAVRHSVDVAGARMLPSGEGPAGREYLDCSVSVTPERGGVAVTRSCSDGRTGCAAKEKSILKDWDETQHVSVKDDALVVSAEKKTVTRREPCEAGRPDGD